MPSDTTPTAEQRDTVAHDRDSLGPVISRGQLLLAATVALLVVLLIWSTTDNAREDRELARDVAASDSASSIAMSTLRDSYGLVVRAEQWFRGGIPRREVQLQRALLQRRLQVTANRGIMAADVVSRSYLDALEALDAGLEATPPGVLTTEQQPAVQASVGPPLREFQGTVNELALTYQRNVDAAQRALAAERSRNLSRSTAILVVVLVLTAVLGVWTGARVTRRYRAARARIASDRAALDRASALERGEAAILADIVRGEPLDEVLVRLLDLDRELSGRRFTFAFADEVVPPGAPPVLEPSPEPDASASPAPAPAPAQTIATWPVAIDDGIELGELRLVGADGDPPPDADLDRLAVRSADLAAVVIDRNLASQRLEHAATHDALTGMPNRSLALQTIDEELRAAAADPAHGQPAVVFCDLDRFKLVNDTLGHRTGDRLLRAVGRRLARAADLKGVTIARLGGDEFVAICRGRTALQTARHVAGRIAEDLMEPFIVDGGEVFVAGSMGIALADASTDSPEGLLRNADVAMYRAKREGGSAHMLYDSELEADLAERLAIDSALRRGLADGEFRAFLQPVADLDSGRVLGVEALARWEHDGRLVPPGEFLDVAEENGLIHEIGRVVIEDAITAVADATTLDPDVSLWVNVSLRQLRDPAFVPWLLDRCEVFGLVPQRLVVELTEGTMMDLGDIGGALEAMQRTGVRIAMDDFGTGYSSLVQLRKLPVDIVKIDRAFVSALNDGGDDARSVLAAAVALVDAVGLDLVVEGIENATELAEVKALGVTVGQGYLLCRPGPAAEILAMVAQRTTVTPG